MIRGLDFADAYPHPCAAIRCVETHISWVYLTGTFAYKVKKPVDFGFLDFSTLEKRHHYCEEELRCNRRFAPGLYVDVVPIRRTDAGRVRVGPDATGEVIEYAVRMRQFPTEAELDVRLANDVLQPTELADFGRDLAAIHARLAPVAGDSLFGTAAAVHEPVLENFAQVAGSMFQAEFETRLARLKRWFDAQHAELATELDARRATGCIRECHGDLHLSNLVVLEGAITAFDCIEFSPALRWIDVISDVAFLVMDCLVRDRADLGYAFLDAYLAVNGDYLGGRLLGYYVVYRSMVRAKVAALRSDAADARARFEQHLAFAERRAFAPAPRLVLTCGLSGSGKSWLAERLVKALGAVRVRSDVERKRLHGLAADAHTGAGLDEGIYGPGATEAVYVRLERAAGALLAGGESAIVDATFLEADRRDTFLGMARALGVPGVVVYCSAPRAVLEARIAARNAAAQDPSDADAAVLARQLQGFAAPRGEAVISIETDTEVDVSALAKQIRAAR